MDAQIVAPPPSRRVAPGPRFPSWPGWRAIAQPLLIAALAVIAAVPVIYVLIQTAAATRNIAYWDEFDTALAFILRLEDGGTWQAFARELFALNNEHRMLTSRLITAALHGITGAVDFRLLGAIGNAALLGACALLLVEAGTALRRLRLAVVLALVVFHLAHYENFFWAGAAIDHLLIVLLAAGAIVAIARRSRRGLIAGGVLAALATFTLAHGIVLWPVGAAMLWADRRRRALLAWGIVAGIVLIGFALGFRVNPGHEFAGASAASVFTIAAFWLTLLGTVPALGSTAIAPWCGVALLVCLGWAARNGGARGERVLFPLACFAIGALALIAIGRAQPGGAVVHSRYLILGALAWAVILFILIDRYSRPERPFALLLAALPFLVGFNLAANHAFAHRADAWIECRDRAAVRYKQHRADGHGRFHLHPQPAHATQVLDQAERRGIYRMPELCEQRSYPDARPSARIAYFIEQLDVTRASAAVVGWAAIPETTSERGALHLVLRSRDKMHVFSTVTVSRPDVAEAHGQPGWVQCGFRFARNRERLPVGEYQVGLLIATGEGAEYIMTAHRLILDGAGEAILAGGD